MKLHLCIYLCLIIAMFYINQVHASPQKFIYLQGDDTYVNIDMRSYMDDTGHERNYIRSTKQGRFLDVEEENNIIPKDYFLKIKRSDPYLAVFESIYSLNRASEYILYSDRLRIEQEDRFSRFMKIGFGVLAAIAYSKTRNDARRLSNTFKGINDENALKNFRTGQVIYYASLSIAAGVFVYDGYLAFTRFGTRDGLEPLNILQRKEQSSDILFNEPSISMRWSLPL